MALPRGRRSNQGCGCALAAVPGGPPPVAPEVLEFLIAQLRTEQAVEARGLAAEVLARPRLNAAQLGHVARALETAGPLELAYLLETFDQTSDVQKGMDLIAGLKASGGGSSLRPEALRTRLARFGLALGQQAYELLAVVEAETPVQRSRFDELLARLGEISGEVRRGQMVFHSFRAACSACHAIAYVGGRVGPALTQVGQLRSERDLLESIVFPSATLVPCYEGVVVVLSDGRVVNGIIVQDLPGALVLATAPNQQTTIAREEIEQIEKSRVSIMPSGLDQQLAREDLADLLAFLKSCK